MNRRKILLTMVLMAILVGCHEPYHDPYVRGPELILNDILFIDGTVNRDPRIVLYIKNIGDRQAYDITGYVDLVDNGFVFDTAVFSDPYVRSGETITITLSFSTIFDHQDYDDYFIDLSWHDYDGNDYYW